MANRTCYLPRRFPAERQNLFEARYPVRIKEYGLVDIYVGWTSWKRKKAEYPTSAPCWFLKWRLQVDPNANTQSVLANKGVGLLEGKLPRSVLLRLRRQGLCWASQARSCKDIEGCLVCAVIQNAQRFGDMTFLLHNIQKMAMWQTFYQ